MRNFRNLLSLSSPAFRKAQPNQAKPLSIRLAAFVLCTRGSIEKNGTQALVIQRGSPAHGAGEVFGLAGRCSKTARTTTRSDQAHGATARRFAQAKERQESLSTLGGQPPPNELHCMVIEASLLSNRRLNGSDHGRLSRWAARFNSLGQRPTPKAVHAASAPGHLRTNCI